MQIIHKIDDFLFTIFPLTNSNDLTALKSWFVDYYARGPFKPKVSIENGFVIIDVDTSMIAEQEEKYQQVVALSEEGKFKEAKTILHSLIEKNPSNSEFHRILGQIVSEEGNQEEAIDCFIDALRWDPKNGNAMIMMGNIFAKYKDDAATALKYYNQALQGNPDDYISINNIGYNLLNENKLEEAKDYFEKSLIINSKYPNAQFALSIIALKEDDPVTAFEATIKTLELCEEEDVLFHKAVKQAIEISSRLIKTTVGWNICNEFRHQLEFEGERDIDIVEDSKISTPAKLEIAENFNRPKHTVKYKKGYPGFEHLIMHELVHLKFIIDARKAGNNQLFVSEPSHREAFKKNIALALKKLKQMGVSPENISNYTKSIFDGINLQMYNAPIDLFIEEYIYIEYPLLRPYQFTSLYGLLSQAMKSFEDDKAMKYSPKEVISINRILNLLNAIQFDILYNLNFIGYFKATPGDIKTAWSLYDEFLEYNKDREPGEEYDLVRHWADDLKMSHYFDLVDENDFRKKSQGIEELIKSLEKDPLGLESDLAQKERDMAKFQKSQAAIGTNMAVVMYMVDALQYFKDMPLDKIKKIAIEIAMQGTQGYSPEKQDYKIYSVPGKTFSGYHILAWYYVSFKLAIPDQLSTLQIPFDKEFEVAQSMFYNDTRTN